jgi:hypothetical protein
MKVALNPIEMADILRYAIDNNKDLTSQGKKSIAYEIVGEAGTAKSSVVEQVAEESGMEFIKINASQVSIDDFVGFPVKEYQMCKYDAAGVETDCHWVAENAIPTYVTLGYTYSNHMRMGYALPKWIQGRTKPLIMLIDDYSRASLPVLQATNEIIDRQEYLSWSLPKGSTVILTSNPDNGDYLVSATDSAMDTRKLKFEMKFSSDAWALWAEKYGIDNRCLNFILKHPEVIEGVGASQDEKGQSLAKGNIRIWTKYFDALSGIKNFNTDLGLVMNLGSGSIPPEHIIFFTTFIKDGLDKIQSPKELLTSSLEKAIDHLEDIINKPEGKRQDLAAIVAKRLLNYALTKPAEFTPPMVERYGELLESGYLSQDLVIVSARKLATSPKFVKLASRPKLLDLIIVK